MQAAVWFNLNSHTAEILGLHDNDLVATDPSYWLDSSICKAEILAETELPKLRNGDTYTYVDQVSLSYLGTAVTRDGVAYVDGNYRGVFAEGQTWITKDSGRRTRHFVVFFADDGANRDGVWVAPIHFQDRETDE